MAQQSLFHQALGLMDKKEYEKAVELLEKVNGVEEASSKMIEARYGYGKKLLEDKKYDRAIEQFKTAGSYKDAPEMIKKTNYEKALSLLEERKYDDSIALFEQLGDYEDAAAQKENAEKEKKTNTVKVPAVDGKSLSAVKKELDKLDLTFTTSQTESADKKADTVLSVTPKTGEEVLKGSSVTLVVTKGLAKYEKYTSDGNTNVLYQVNITASGNNIVIRKAPHLDASNRAGKRTKSGEAYNVYETVKNEGYTFLRTDNNEWFATENNWVERDSYCSEPSNCMNRKAWIYAIDGSGVYDRPSENLDTRVWIEDLPNGTEVTVYYRFYNGSHYWYKIGANRWIKDVNGEKVKFYQDEALTRKKQEHISYT